MTGWLVGSGELIQAAVTGRPQRPVSTHQQLVRLRPGQPVFPGPKVVWELRRGGAQKTVIRTTIVASAEKGHTLCYVSATTTCNCRPLTHLAFLCLFAKPADVRHGNVYDNRHAIFEEEFA